MQLKASSRAIRIGIFDHTGPSLGGGTNVAAHLAWVLSQFYSVELIRDWSAFNLSQVSAAFSLDLARVQPRPFADIWESFAVPSRYSFRQQLQRSRALTAGYDLFIDAGHWIPPFCYAKHGLIYCHFPIEVPLDSQLLSSDERWNHRRSLDRWARMQAYLLAWRACLSGYDHVLANSAFTAGWIERRWHTQASVLYPPIELQVPKSEKRNRIVSIGRFVKDERSSKGQLVQVAAFRDFLKGVREPWELWMIGFCSSDDRPYLLAAQEAARDLPVHFFINAQRGRVVEAVAAAKVFWHTAGSYKNESADPVFSEHFGMATVEAMRAGCVPVVLSSGGQTEIIQNGINGFLCCDTPELVRRTTEIAENTSVLTRLSQQAVVRSNDFNGEVFNTQVLRWVEKTLRARPRHPEVRALLNRLADESSWPSPESDESFARKLPSLIEPGKTHASISRRGIP